MAGKLSFLVGLGAGYVLGARSGRERYDQIASKAQQLWRDPRVQEKANQAQQLAKDKAGAAASAMADKATEAGAVVASKAKNTIGSGGPEDSASGPSVPVPGTGSTRESGR